MIRGNAKLSARGMLAELGVLGGIAVFVLMLLVVVVLFGVRQLVLDAMLPAAEAVDVLAVDEARIQRFETSFDDYVAQVSGRSMFFVPLEPPPPPRAAPVRLAEREPPPPARYEGPRIIAMVHDRVWFEDGRRLVVGGEADNGLRVVATLAPWSAKIEWRGVEFDVDFIRRTTGDFLQSEGEG